jgi:hypothetical protein
MSLITYLDWERYDTPSAKLLLWRWGDLTHKSGLRLLESQDDRFSFNALITRKAGKDFSFFQLRVVEMRDTPS